jgi:hypothetical protein
LFVFEGNSGNSSTNLEIITNTSRTHHEQDNFTPLPHIAALNLTVDPLELYV